MPFTLKPSGTLQAHQQALGHALHCTAPLPREPTDTLWLTVGVRGGLDSAPKHLRHKITTTPPADHGLRLAEINRGRNWKRRDFYVDT